MVRYRPDQVRLNMLVARLSQFPVPLRDVDEHFLDGVFGHIAVMRMHVGDAEEVVVVMFVQVCDGFFRPGEEQVSEVVVFHRG